MSIAANTQARRTTSFTLRTALVSVGQGTVKASQLVITLALVHLLSPEEWTRTAYLLSIHLAAVAIGSLNLQHTIVFFVRHLGPGSERRLVTRTVACLAGVGMAIAGALTLAGPALSGGRLSIDSALPWVCLAIVLEIPVACASTALVAIDDMAGAALWDISTAALQTVIVIIASGVGDGVRAVAIGLAVAAAIRFLLLAVVVVRLPGGAGRLPEGTLRRQLRYGLPLGLALGTAVLNRSVDKWFVAWFDPAAVGVYSVAAQEIPLLAVVPYAAGAAVVGSLVDAFRNDDSAAALAIWLRVTTAMSTVVVPLAAALILVAPPVFALVFDAEFAVGVLSFQLFAAISLHRVAEYGLIFRAADRTRDLLWASAVLLGSNLVLAGVGSWLGGMTGAAAGTLLANAVAWLFVLNRLTVLFDAPFRQVFPWIHWGRSLGRASCSFGAAAFVVGLVPDRSPAIEAAVGLTVFAASYLALTQVRA